MLVWVGPRVAHFVHYQIGRKGTSHLPHWRLHSENEMEEQEKVKMEKKNYPIGNMQKKVCPSQEAERRWECGQAGPVHCKLYTVDCKV